MGTATFLVVKRPGRCVNHPTSIYGQGSRKSGAMYLPPLCAFMAGYRVIFASTLWLGPPGNLGSNPRRCIQHIIGRLLTSSQGGKAAGAWSWPLTSTSCRRYECMEPYLHSPYECGRLCLITICSRYYRSTRKKKSRIIPLHSSFLFKRVSPYTRCNTIKLVSVTVFVKQESFC